MRVTEKNSPFVFVIIFILFSFVLPFFAFGFGMLGQGGTSKVGLYAVNFVLYFANWPSFLLRIYPTVKSLNGKDVYAVDIALINLKVITANATGWGLIGFIVGLIITTIKGRKRRRAQKKVGSKE